VIVESRALESLRDEFSPLLGHVPPPVTNSLQTPGAAAPPTQG